MRIGQRKSLDFLSKGATKVDLLYLYQSVNFIGTKLGAIPRLPKTESLLNAVGCY